jgi:hypothetical protein
MAKNYKLMYKKLLKDLRRDFKIITENYEKLDYSHINLADKLEHRANRDFLKWLLHNYIPELEGKQWENCSFTEEEWKAWKKKIGVK